VSTFRDWAQAEIHRLEREVKKLGLPPLWWQALRIPDELISNFGDHASEPGFVGKAVKEMIDWSQFAPMIDKFGSELHIVQAYMYSFQAGVLSWALQGDEPERLFAAGRLYANADAYLSSDVLAQNAITLARWRDDPRHGFWMWADAAYAENLTRGLKPNHAAAVLWQSSEWGKRAAAAGVTCTKESARTTLQKRRAKPVTD
jgi:hypothetical protein